MAQQTPPYVISAATHSAALFRQAKDGPFSRRGVLGLGEYNVAQQLTPNMSVQIGAGRVMIPGTQGVTPAGFAWSTQGSYFAENDASATVVIATSNPTNPRIDVVYVAVQDAFYSGAANQVVLAVATGTPSASPAVPAIPANAVALAQVAVAANVSTIVNANIANVANIASAIAICLGGVMPVANVGAYPATPYVGQMIDDASLGPLRWSGSVWETVSDRVRMQYEQASGGQTLANGSFTTITGLTGAGVDTFGGSSFNTSTGVWTCPAAASYLISGQVTATGAVAPRLIGGISKNGSILFSTYVAATSTVWATAVFGPKEFTLAAGDTITLQGNVNTAGCTTGVQNGNASFIRIERNT